MLDHPSGYAYVVRENKHPESRREPKAVVPAVRRSPPRDFVKKLGNNAGYLYVDGLHHPIVDGDLGTWDNPLHRHEITEAVANLFEVNPLDVCPATMTSAFIIFKDYQEAARAVSKTKSKRVKHNPVNIALYAKQEDNTKEADEKATVQNMKKSTGDETSKGDANISATDSEQDKGEERGSK